MFPLGVTKDPTAVEVEVQNAYCAMFPHGDKLFVPQVFGWANECFTGQYANYQAVDAKYHDFEHTLQGTLCMVRLLHGRQQAAADPPLNGKLFQLGLVAILFHDTGYLKEKGDVEGTGAKYTVTHVVRSTEFAAQFLKTKGFRAEDIQSIQNMILCTGVNASLNLIPFQSELEKIMGYALGTADLLGQMAAEDYVDKLPVLYSEFAEAAHHQREKTNIVGMFSSADDLMRKTPVFWEKYVQPKLSREFGGLYRYLNQPFPFGPNFYLQRIEANMNQLQCLLDGSTPPAK
ncbi:MAG: hypothetical protein JWR19_4610 [Pedosphaera sp.]|nr:hypothetical protein [Pedosphaera sp.]